MASVVGALVALFVLFMLIGNPIAVAIRARRARRRDPRLTWETFDAQ